jgi:proteasome assembly chaperone (PAC2) family protein
VCTPNRTAGGYRPRPRYAVPGVGQGGPYSGVVLEIDAWPQLRAPVLVVALAGWVDAGEAGAGAATVLAGQLEGARAFGTYDLTDLLDLQQTRPTVELDEGSTRRVTWPGVALTAGRAGRDVVLFVGPEPSLRWPTFVGDLVELAGRLGVERAFTLGGMPAVVSHRRPVPVLATATSPSLAQEAGAVRADYEGPTGAQTVLQVGLGEAGVPTVGLWAQVPHYVAGNASPPAIRALLERLRELAAVSLDVALLDEECDVYVTKVEEGLAERPDVAELVRAIEAEQPAEDMSGDELAAEIERYLREQ